MKETTIHAAIKITLFLCAMLAAIVIGSSLARAENPWTYATPNPWLFAKPPAACKCECGCPDKPCDCKKCPCTCGCKKDGKCDCKRSAKKACGCGCGQKDCAAGRPCKCQKLTWETHDGVQYEFKGGVWTGVAIDQYGLKWKDGKPVVEQSAAPVIMRGGSC